MNREKFIHFKNQSYLSELIKLGKQGEFNHTYIFFGGTGAVGGQALIEMIHAYEFMFKVSILNSDKNAPLFIVTGRYMNEIDLFVSKLYRSFQERGKFHGFNSEKADDDSAFTVSRKSGIIIKFYILDAAPKFKNDLEEVISLGETIDEKIQILKHEMSNIISPFTQFVKDIIRDYSFSNSHQFEAVFSGIPIPSLAAYHFNKIDKIIQNHNIQKFDENKKNERAIKNEILRGLARDFGEIKEKYSKSVLIAHTTSVGGMYTIEDGAPVIKLGYAHSSTGELLKEKQYYAEQLTIEYSKLGLKTLITAAAIGIDYIFNSGHLAMSK